MHLLPVRAVSNNETKLSAILTAFKTYRHAGAPFVVASFGTATELLILALGF